MSGRRRRLLLLRPCRVPPEHGERRCSAYACEIHVVSSSVGTHHDPPVVDTTREDDESVPQRTDEVVATGGPEEPIRAQAEWRTAGVAGRWRQEGGHRHMHHHVSGAFNGQGGEWSVGGAVVSVRQSRTGHAGLMAGQRGRPSGVIAREPALGASPERPPRAPPPRSEEIASSRTAYPSVPDTSVY